MMSTTRYEGLIRTTQELFDHHEESGWRLANVIYDAFMELLEQGYNKAIPKVATRMSAPLRLSRDLARHGMSPSNVYCYHLTWERYGDASLRHPGLTYGDHYAMAVSGNKEEVERSAAVAALQKRRADIQAGRKPDYASADITIGAIKRGRTSALRRTHFQRLSLAKSGLRYVLKTNVWDYPDHQEVLDRLDEIQALLDDVRAKPWNQKDDALSA